MPDFITLTCPQCGGKLQITNDIDRFACQYCGAEHIVRRGGGIVSLAPVVEKLEGIEKEISKVVGGVGQVERHSKKVAAELAITRLRRELDEAEEELKRLMAKPESEFLKSLPTNRKDTWGGCGCLMSIILGGLAFVIGRNSPNNPVVLYLLLAAPMLGLIAILLLGNSRTGGEKTAKLLKREKVTKQNILITDLKLELKRNEKIARE